MSTGGTITGALAGWVLLDLVLTGALLVRLRGLQRRLAQEGGLPDLTLPRVGSAVGAFEAALPAGEPVSDRALRSGTTLVGFFAAGCAPCEALRAQLLQSPPPLESLFFVHAAGPAAADARSLLASLQRLFRVAPLGEDVGRAFGMTPETGFPVLLRVEEGVIAAAGSTLEEVLPW